ncbi:integrase catalytic domain-containing protein [Nephila pilipes]|uniref:Integrase catalytic domain-containing protein n=1 Tax=Nephila pilipes TaxID=299642 RepID=A0A8X6T770_NEPPI|nr:integrase catalytic domain-containing protein [Nephila pilipes]
MSEELKKAELKILKKVHEDSFQGEKMQHLKSSSTFKGVDGVLRIKTKLRIREDNENFKITIVLSFDYHVVKSFVQTPRAGHPEVQFLMVSLRENYWTIKS